MVQSRKPRKCGSSMSRVILPFEEVQRDGPFQYAIPRSQIDLKPCTKSDEEPSYWSRLFGQAGPLSFSAKVVHFRLTADMTGIRLQASHTEGGSRAIQEKGHLAYQRITPAS